MPYSITFDVEPDVNQSSIKKPSPIVLTVFQLKAAFSFRDDGIALANDSQASQ